MVQDPLEFIELLGDGAGLAQPFAPGLGEVDALAQLFEERYAQTFFELLDLHRHGRLGKEKLFRRAGIVQMPRDRFKDLELAQREVHSIGPDMTISNNLS